MGIEAINTENRIKLGKRLCESNAAWNKRCKYIFFLNVKGPACLYFSDRQGGLVTVNGAKGHSAIRPILLTEELPQEKSS